MSDEREVVTGKSFEDLTEEEMQQSQGAGDIEGDTTPLTVVTTSSFPCSAGLGAGATAILSIKHC